MTIRRHWWSGLSLGLSLCIVVGCALWALHVNNELERQAYRMQVLRDMVATTDHGLVVINPAGQIVEWGPGAESLFGWRSAEVMGSTLDFLMPMPYCMQHKAALAKRGDSTIKKRGLVTVDCWAFHKDGHLIPVHVIVSSFFNHIGLYHVAMITPQDKVRNPVAVEKPENPGTPSVPMPQPVLPPPRGWRHSWSPTL